VFARRPMGLPSSIGAYLYHSGKPRANPMRKLGNNTMGYEHRATDRPADFSNILLRVITQH